MHPSTTTLLLGLFSLFGDIITVLVLIHSIFHIDAIYAWYASGFRWIGDKIAVSVGRLTCQLSMGAVLPVPDRPAAPARTNRRPEVERPSILEVEVKPGEIWLRADGQMVIINPTGSHGLLLGHEIENASAPVMVHNSTSYNSMLYNRKTGQGFVRGQSPLSKGDPRYRLIFRWKEAAQ